MAYRQKTSDREADWARQDEQLARQERTSEQVQQVAESLDAAAVTRGRITSKLDVIHHLVNGNVTGAMQSELDALVREVALRRELKTLKRGSKSLPDTAGMAQVALCEARIAELRRGLRTRTAAHARAAIVESKPDDHQPEGRKAKVYRPDRKKGD